eukprot:scaffold7352_cov254-Pinguiococcus_pyrenoidosus.AAC.10
MDTDGVGRGARNRPPHAYGTASALQRVAEAMGKGPRDEKAGARLEQALQDGRVLVANGAKATGEATVRGSSSGACVHAWHGKCT